LKQKHPYICSDNGAEFNMKKFYDAEGIVHQTSCVETPEQNGVVERKHQHLMNVTGALLFRSSIPVQFWSFAVLHAAYLINRTLTPFLKNSSPFEMLYNKNCDLSHIRVFGCLCYNSTLIANRNELDPRADIDVFLGFKLKGYVVYKLKTHAITVSGVFYEDVFPYSKQHNETSNQVQNSPPPISQIYQEELNEYNSDDNNIVDTNSRDEDDTSNIASTNNKLVI